MTNGKKMRRELKGAEVKQLAEKGIESLQGIASHSTYGICWEYYAERVNKVAEILEVPYNSNFLDILLYYLLTIAR